MDTTVTIDEGSLEDVELVHCPLCQASDPFDTGDWHYQCQVCGAEFVLVRGRQDLDQD